MTDKDLELLDRVIQIVNAIDSIRGQFDWKSLFVTDGDTDLITSLNDFQNTLETKTARYFLNWSDEAKRIASGNRKREIAE